MNYDAFMEPVTWFLTGMKKHSDEMRPDSLGNPDYFLGAMHHNMARIGGQSYSISMNELSNHDHSRFLTRTNHIVGRVDKLGSEVANQNVNKFVFMEAVIIQMTWPGAPTVFCNNILLFLINYDIFLKYIKETSYEKSTIN